MINQIESMNVIKNRVVLAGSKASSLEIRCDIICLTGELPRSRNWDYVKSIPWTRAALYWAKSVFQESE